ncbi:hypothetical protein EVAR_10021_1 [Eumeta japonica]|uniref:Uncharacterized protein n=1 Tax=Eumeta variegata TaxID=151549 RepID=A0A4C1TR21_EUMVA|nr:hypothetical protein EVAR_10021_1 [Eumeta japonica]
MGTTRQRVSRELVYEVMEHYVTAIENLTSARKTSFSRTLRTNRYIPIQGVMLAATEDSSLVTRHVTSRRTRDARARLSPPRRLRTTLFVPAHWPKPYVTPESYFCNKIVDPKEKSAYQ